MNRRNFIAIASVGALTGCASLREKLPSLNTAKGVAKGASAVLEAEGIHAELVEYLDGDVTALAALASPAAFFQRGVDAINGDLERPVVELFEEYPEYIASVEAQWEAGIAAIAEYAGRNKDKPVPKNIIAWQLNAEAGWKAAQKAKRLHDVTVKAVNLYKIAKPFALLVL